jgi:uncharacterized protein (TIGR02145 family)
MGSQYAALKIIYRIGMKSLFNIIMMSFVFAGIILISSSCSKEEDDSLLVTDIDGNVYATVLIGNQTWLDRNLITARYNNSDTILTVSGALSVNDNEKRYQWVYDDNVENEIAFGRLYTWHTVVDSRGICPVGWRIPTLEELETLIEHLGGSLVAGGRMKTAENSNWRFPNDEATNESGFSLQPAGSRSLSGIFAGACMTGGFWTSTESSTVTAMAFGASYGSGNAYLSTLGKQIGVSVRCIKED